MTNSPNVPLDEHTSPSVPQGYPQAPANRTRTLWLAIGIPVAIILFLAVVAVAILALRGLTPAGVVDTNATLGNAQSVSVNAPNAKLDLSPSTDGQIHVTMTGNYTGPAPTLTTRVVGGVAQINTECSKLWLSRCDLTLTVTLPSSADVAASGINGRVTLSDLDGDIRVETVNGSIEATGTRGQLDFVTVNGQVTVKDAASEAVNAETVNGSVDLTFRAAPSAVMASSINGSIAVRVPDDGSSYAVTASTVVGKVDTGNIHTDSAARHTISAETVNGSITVGVVGG